MASIIYATKMFLLLCTQKTLTEEEKGSKVIKRKDYVL